MRFLNVFMNCPEDSWGCNAPKSSLWVDIPRKAQIARTVTFPHHALGAVLFQKTVVEDDVVNRRHITINEKPNIWNKKDWRKDE